ncbi:MAG: hypothetical protein LC624_09725 [Halobacteriales archaeon]|nr:hypothetical protein [Halobacteriales archaeon]
MRLAPLALAAALVASPLGLASLALPSTPVSAFCLNVGTDTCTAAPYTPIGNYGYQFLGVFVGTVQIVTDAPGIHHAYTCTNAVLLGFAAFDPASVFSDCQHEGDRPPAGVPITLSCNSEGVGVVTCSLLEAP